LSSESYFLIKEKQDPFVKWLIEEPKQEKCKMSLEHVVPECKKK
jgi:hypothetical protein